MSNQPKITYRSDSTGINYMMQLEKEGFVVEWVYQSGKGGGISPMYPYLSPWRLTVIRFFDIVANHINTGEWLP